jgi:hypothetical protein
VAPPLSRLSLGQLPASAIAIGAMAPDLEYLVFLETRRTIGHSPLGLVLFCLPVSLVCLLVWHVLVKRPLGQLLPDRWAYVYKALDRPFPFRTWRDRTRVIVAIFVGAASHVIWDAFTHAGSAGVALLPRLRNTVPVVGLPAYSVLQYAGGLVGMAILGLAVLLWAGQQPRVQVQLPPARDRLIAVNAIIAVALAVAAVNTLRISEAGVTATRVLIVAAVLGAMTGGSIAMTAYAAIRRSR